jgi:hypothetical protein
MNFAMGFARDARAVVEHRTEALGVAQGDDEVGVGVGRAQRPPEVIVHFTTAARMTEMALSLRRAA